MRPPSASERHERLGEHDDAGDVGVEQRAHRRDVGAAERGQCGEARVVDEHVEPGAAPRLRQRGAQGRREGGEGLGLGGVETQRDGGAAEHLDLGHDGLGLVRVAPEGDDDVGAVGGEGQCLAAAEAAVAAGDERDPCHVLHPAPTWWSEECRTYPGTARPWLRRWAAAPWPALGPHGRSCRPVRAGRTPAAPARTARAPRTARSGRRGRAR